MRQLTVLSTFIIGLISASALFAQPAAPGATQRLIAISGAVPVANGQQLAPLEQVTFAIYADATGGAPLWHETQEVRLDAAGRYTVLLGATAADGMPLDIFVSAEARWLAVTVVRPGEVEGPRVPLTSVPYALHAANADTLGGRPASAYVLAPTEGDKGGRPAQSTRTSGEDVMTNGVLSGTTNFLSKYVNSSDVGDSAVYEAFGAVGIGTSTPFDSMHVRFTNTGGSQTGLAVQNLGATSNSYSGMLFYDQNGALGQFQGFNNLTHEYRINNIARVSQPAGAFNGSINFMIGGASQFFVGANGNIGIGTIIPTTKLHVAGDVFVSGNIGAKYQDVAEWVDATERLEPGTVVVIDPASSNGVRAASAAYDSAVAGAVSVQPGIVLGESAPGRVLVAQSGRVRIKVDASFGAIRPGDLLVTSPNKGYAMRSEPVRIGDALLHRPGTVLGKALEPLQDGTGEILVLLTLQ